MTWVFKYADHHNHYNYSNIKPIHERRINLVYVSNPNRNNRTNTSGSPSKNSRSYIVSCGLYRGSWIPFDSWRACLGGSARTFDWNIARSYLIHPVLVRNIPPGWTSSSHHNKYQEGSGILYSKILGCGWLSYDMQHRVRQTARMCHHNMFFCYHKHDEPIIFSHSGGYYNPHKCGQRTHVLVP